MVVPIVLVLAVVAVGVRWAVGDSGDDPPAPLAVTAEGPRFATTDDLAAASDVAVIGSVVRVDEGRAITDPDNPAAGIRTQLATIEVGDILLGESNGPLIVEQEFELLDGTPIVVNGVPPLAVGDMGAMFVVRGDSEEFPYVVFVNEQGWVPIIDGAVAADRPR